MLDHYEAVRREIRLMQLQPGEPPARLEDLASRLAAEFPRSNVDEVAERAYQAGEPEFVAHASVPDDLVAAAIQACDELVVLLEELDEWAHDKQVNLLAAPEDVKRYRVAYLGQARQQLQAALR
jgi:hypothetical protein